MKRKIIFFLSTLILSATLSSTALAYGITPNWNVPIGAPAKQFVNRHDRCRFDEKDAKAFVDKLVADKVIPRETETNCWPISAKNVRRIKPIGRRSNP